MNFWEGSARGGDLIIGFREGWHFVRENGGYYEKSDFFYMHYEIKKHTPERVLFHIEAPKKDTDKDLNLIKRQLSNDLISAKDKFLSSNWEVNEGRQSSKENLKNNVSSTVLTFSLREEKNNLGKDYKKIIEILDDSVGDLIDGMAYRYTQRLIDLGLKKTDSFK